MDDIEAGAAPGMPPQGGDEMAEQPDSYTICILVEGGQLSVGVERGAPAAPMAPGPAGMEPEAAGPEYTPVSSIKEALTRCLDIYRNDGGMGDDAVADAEFDSGFSRREPM